jgi:hypothetical protein
MVKSCIICDLTLPSLQLYVTVFSICEQTLYSPYTPLLCAVSSQAYHHYITTGDQYSQTAVQITDQQEGTVAATDPENSNSPITNNQYKVPQCNARIKSSNLGYLYTHYKWQLRFSICFVHQQ